MDKNSFIFIPIAVALALSSSSATANPSRAEALAAAAAGHADTVESTLVTLATTTPPDIEASVALAHLREQQNRSKEAVQLIDIAISADPKRSTLYSELGSALAYRLHEVSFMQQAVLAGRMKGAYEKAVALDPNNLWGWVGLAEYCANAPAMAGGSMEKAEKYAHEIEAREPFWGAMELGALEFRQNKLAEAAEHFQAATRLKPNDASAWTALGQVQVKQGQSGAARTSFEAALKLDPKNSGAAQGLQSLEATASKPAL